MSWLVKRFKKEQVHPGQFLSDFVNKFLKVCPYGSAYTWLSELTNYLSPVARLHFFVWLRSFSKQRLSWFFRLSQLSCTLWSIIVFCLKGQIVLVAKKAPLLRHELDFKGSSVNTVLHTYKGQLVFFGENMCSLYVRSTVKYIWYPEEVSKSSLGHRRLSGVSFSLYFYRSFLMGLCFESFKQTWSTLEGDFQRILKYVLFQRLLIG